MKDNNKSIIIEVDGQQFEVTSIFDDNADNDIINLIYEKYKDNSDESKLF